MKWDWRVQRRYWNFSFHFKLRLRFFSIGLLSNSMAKPKLAIWVILPLQRQFSNQKLELFTIVACSPASPDRALRKPKSGRSITATLSSRGRRTSRWHPSIPAIFESSYTALLITLQSVTVKFFYHQTSENLLRTLQRRVSSKTTGSLKSSNKNRVPSAESSLQLTAVEATSEELLQVWLHFTDKNLCCSR